MKDVIAEREEPKITAAIQQFYRDADYQPDPSAPGILKLYDRIRDAYPIRIVELKDLTYQQAIEFLVAETGQIIPLSRNEDRSLSGFLYAKGVYGCILIKKNDPVVRRRFSVAHELGHYVLHFLPLLEMETQQGIETEEIVLAEGLTYPDSNEQAEEMPVGQLTFTRRLRPEPTPDEVIQMELEANQFAAALLMPALACRNLVEQFAPRFGTRRAVLARRLATELLVSKAAMLWRLNDLNLPQNS
jgi:Zn-dependent peptidase ImmA (M78 family)